MKLILVRHGETLENQKGILQGQMQGTLSPAGKKQAQQVAQRLKGEKIDVIYSSDLARAVETADAIARFHPKARVHLVKELRETDLGTLTGASKHTVDWERLPPDVESREALWKRASEFLRKVYDKHPSDTVVFVGHSGINRALTAVLLNKSSKEINSIERQQNASVSIFEIKKDKNHLALVLNSTEHLG